MRSGIDFKKINFINIIGTSGSGKTTFGRELSEILKIPLLEMDKIFWKPDWTIPDELEFFSKLKNELNTDRWILDGNYKRTTFIKWQKTQVVIWLDYSFHRTFYRSLSRSLSRAISQKELWENTGNRESLSRTFLNKESILLWVIKTHRKNRIKYDRIMNDEKYSGIKFVRLKTPSETEKFLQDIKSQFK